MGRHLSWCGFTVRVRERFTCGQDFARTAGSGKYCIESMAKEKLFFWILLVTRRKVCLELIRDAVAIEIVVVRWGNRWGSVGILVTQNVNKMEKINTYSTNICFSVI